MVGAVVDIVASFLMENLVLTPALREM